MDCPSRRRKSSFSGEEELRKMSRVWIQDTQGMNLQQQLVVPTGDHHMIHRLQQNEQTGPAPPLNMQQRAMAAIALQEIRSSIDPTKHLQQQQQNQQLLQKYHQQLVQQLKPVSTASNPLLIDTRYTHTLPVLKQNGSSVETLASPQLISMPVVFSTSSSTSSLPVVAPVQPSSSSIPTSLRPPVSKEHYPNPICSNMAAPSNRSPSWFPQAPYGQPGPGIFMNDFADRSGTGGNVIDQEQLQQIQPLEMDPVATYNSNIGTPAKVSSNMVAPPVYSNGNTNIKNKTQNQALMDQAVSDSKNTASENLDAQQHKIVPSNSSQKPPQHHQPQQQQRQPPTRTFTKVYKLGSIGRAIDVARFKNYVELRAELSRMFGLDGQLDQKSGWQLVFVDKENDLLLVGDDPWEEFVNSVRGIRILSPSEVSYYTSDERGTEIV